MEGWVSRDDTRWTLTPVPQTGTTFDGSGGADRWTHNTLTFNINQSFIQFVITSHHILTRPHHSLIILPPRNFFLFIHSGRLADLAPLCARWRVALSP